MEVSGNMPICSMMKMSWSQLETNGGTRNRNLGVEHAFPLFNCRLWRPSSCRAIWTRAMRIVGISAVSAFVFPDTRIGPRWPE